MLCFSPSLFLSRLLTSCSCSLSLFILDLSRPFLFFFSLSTIEGKSESATKNFEEFPFSFFPSTISRSRFPAYENLVLIVFNPLFAITLEICPDIHSKNIYHEENTIPRDFYFSSILFEIEGNAW